MSQALDALIVELQADVKGLQTALSSAAGDVQRFSGKASSHIDGFQASVLRARTAILSLGAAWAAFNVGKGIVDAGVQLEAMQSKMMAATGSAAVAANSFAFVREEANRLGLDIRTTSDGFAGFAASSLRSGLTLQQTKDIFTGVSEAAVSMRLPAEQVSLVFKALEQMAGKGTVSMEELRGQLGDALPGAFEIAAKAMGKTTAEFSAMVANGEVMASDFLPRFGEAVRRELGGSVDEASKGAQAAFNRLGNAFFDLKAQMADAGFLDAVTDAVRDLTTALNDPATVAGLKGFASLLADIVTAATQAAAAVGGFYAAAQQRKADLASWDGTGNVYDHLDEAEKTRKLREQVLAEFTARQQAIAAQRAKSRGFGAAKPVQPFAGYSLGTAANVFPAASADGKGETARKAAEARQRAEEQASEARRRAEEQAAALKEQMSGQVDSLRYGWASPEQQAGMDVEKQQDTLRKALEAKAITEQEFRDLSLEAELDYQERLSAIRDGAREQEMSAIEGFLGARIRSQEEFNKMSLADQAGNFRQTIAQAAQHNRAFFALEKAAALARALIEARESVISAFKFGTRIGGPQLGAVFAGVAAAAQAANISALASTSFGSSNGVAAAGGATPSDSTGNAVVDQGSSSNATQKSVYITLNGDDAMFYSKNSIRKLLEGINDALGDGSQLKIAS